MPFLRMGEEVGRMSSGSRVTSKGEPKKPVRRSSSARHCEEPVQGCDEVQSRQGTESTLRRSALLLLLVFTGSIHAETWMGLEVEPENRCSAYNRDRDYRYSQSLEPAIAARMGGIRCRYTGKQYRSLGETDIEHIVAVSEAHDSGLCAADAATKRRFANDLLNLTLSDPVVNRHQKRDKDAGEWMPRLDPHEFAKTVILVKLKYGLTIDWREKKALERALEGLTVRAVADSVEALADSLMDENPLDLWDDNGNGRITCAEARRHGIAPVPRDHPAYVYMRDGDGDGWVCE